MPEPAAIDDTANAADEPSEMLRRFLRLAGLSEDGVPEPETLSPTDSLSAKLSPPFPLSRKRKRGSSGAALTGGPTAGVEAAHDPEEPPVRYSVRIRELPSDERPRERLIHYGADALSTSELLAILLRTGTEQRSAVSLAELVLSTFHGIRGVAGASVEELAAVHGIGPAKAAQIKAAIEFGRRLVAASPAERPKIRSPRDVYDLLGPQLRDEKREHFVALLLDTKNGVIRQRTVSVGDLSSSIVHPREVFLEAIRHSAASLIVAHNHPSGDPSPSPEDASVTRRLVEAGELLGIEVLDHVVLGDGRWASLKEKGLM